MDRPVFRTHGFFHTHPVGHQYIRTLIEVDLFQPLSRQFFCNDGFQSLGHQRIAKVPTLVEINEPREGEFSESTETCSRLPRLCNFEQSSYQGVLFPKEGLNNSGFLSASDKNVGHLRHPIGSCPGYSISFPCKCTVRDVLVRSRSQDGYPPPCVMERASLMNSS